MLERSAFAMPMLPAFRHTWNRFRSRERAGSGWSRNLLAVVCFGSLTAHGWSAERPVTISLEELGQQPMGARPATPGSTVATVNFVGDHHLLVTFPVRRLMKRLPESKPEDEDRSIEAVLVDVPSGKAAARTTWRVHDAGQYLWDLGEGRFLVRIRERLAVIAPLANLSTEHPFEEHHLLGFDRKIVGILVSAESDLLTVETKDPEAAKGEPGSRDKPKNDLVEVNFYRILGSGTAAGAQHSGVVRARVAIEVPMTTDGYLDISEESRTRWLFDYYSHEGKKTELAPFDTSCFPRATFVSRSEFVAFGCRGSQDKVEIGGFDVRGRQMWQQNFYDNFIHPTFSFAPESGRFAMGRAITLSAPSIIGQDPMGDQLTGQDIQVLQMHSGKQIFHVAVTPAQRNGQNFSLSRDGMELAVIRGGAVEVYKLPALSGKDRQEVKAARDVVLDKSSGPIHLAARTQKSVTTALAPVTPVKEAPAIAVVPDSAGKVASAIAAVPATAPAKPVEHTVIVGDVPDDGPRKKPTLYNEGDVKPQ